MPVYLIQAGTVGPVKIGKADDPTSRLADLQTAHYETLRLLRVWDGGLIEEAGLHSRFSDLHIRGEWFAFSRAMLADVGLTEIGVPVPVVMLVPEGADTIAPADLAGHIIRCFGGATKIALVLDTRQNAVCLWRHSGIPWKFWHRLKDLSAEVPGLEGLSFAQLEAAAAHYRAARQVSA